MKKKRTIVVCAVTAAWLGVFTLLAIAATTIVSAEVEGIPPVLLRQQLTIDSIRRDRDLLKITSNWPTSLIVENVSDKNVSGFLIAVTAADHEGGPGRHIGWGTNPDFEKQDPLFKPGETRTLPISEDVVKTFDENNKANDKPLIALQLADVWVDNDPNYKYMYGALVKRDPNDPDRYYVIVDALGRSVTYDANGNRTVGPLPKDHKHNHHAVPAVPHISHSVRLSMPLGCCLREPSSFVTFDCNHFDPCDTTGTRKCRITNQAFSFCTTCCSTNQTTALFDCESQNIFCGYSCTEKRSVTHPNPYCQCCGC
jgi:hypothetical protein